MTYYFLVASLPALSLGAPPPLSQEDFLSQAERLLVPADRAALHALLEGDEESARDPFARRWFAMETQLRNALARTRAARLGVDPGPYQVPHEGFSNYIEMAVLDAFAKANPMERALTLARFRWSLLDEWTRETPFGFEAVQAYALKLQIVHRWGAMTDDKGRARLKELVRQVREAGAARAAQAAAG